MSSWNNKQLLGNVKNSAHSLDPVTGTTENADVEVVDLDLRQNRDSVFTISNTGANSLYYTAKVRNDYANGKDFTLFSNEITTADRDELVLVRHSRIFIYMKSHVLDTPTDFSITAIGGS